MVGSDSIFLIVSNGNVMSTKVYVDGVPIEHDLTRIEILIDAREAKVRAEITIMNRKFGGPTELHAAFDASQCELKEEEE